MTTDRQVVERAWRWQARLITAFALVMLLILSYHLGHSVSAFGPPLPEGLAMFAGLAFPFLLLLYGLSRLIRWIVLGFVADKEHRAQGGKL